MNTFKIPFTWLIIAGLLLVVALQRRCVGYTPLERTTPKTRTILIHDTLTHTLHTPQQVRTCIMSIHDNIWKNETKAELDTDISRYYQTEIYQKVYSDSSIHLTTHITVFKNKVTDETIQYKLLKPQAIYSYTTITHPNRYTHMYVTGSLLLNPHSDLMIQGICTTPRKGIFSIGYMPLNKAWVAGVGIRLF